MCFFLRADRQTVDIQTYRHAQFNTTYTYHNEGRDCTGIICYSLLCCHYMVNKNDHYIDRLVTVVHYL